VGTLNFLKNKKANNNEEAAKKLMQSLGTEDSQKLMEILSDPQKIKNVLATKEAEEIMKKLKGGM
jgi:mannitol/fructose-specific phosphotransferase system IIA component (Ntr-type)